MVDTGIEWLQQRLAGEGAPVIMDGGMGTELEKAGVPMHDRVWSGHAVLDQPETVRKVHESFIRCGAEVIIANTFSAGRHMLEPAGLGDQVKAINTRAVEVARQARDNAAESPVAVAGSICEWAFTRGQDWSPEAVGESATEQAGLLAEAGVDLIALEMCQNLPYSLAVTEAAFSVGLPVWIGVSAMHHRGNEELSTFDEAHVPFEPLVEALASYPAMLFNIMHTAVPDVPEALDVARRYWDGPLGVYPESGFFRMPNWQFVDIISPEDLAGAAVTWVNAGVRLAGGCCGLGPEHIDALRKALAT